MLLVPLCDDGLLRCDPVVELCEGVLPGLVVWLDDVPLVPGLALVEPWVEVLLPVLPV